VRKYRAPTTTTTSTAASAATATITTTTYNTTATHCRNRQAPRDRSTLRKGWSAKPIHRRKAIKILTNHCSSSSTTIFIITVKGSRVAQTHKKPSTPN
jgi:hypothetical protein